MKRLILLLLLIILFATTAYAGSTATQILIGYYATSGCPTGQSSCWLPYTTSNPLPVVM